MNNEDKKLSIHELMAEIEESADELARLIGVPTVKELTISEMIGMPIKILKK